MAIVLDDYMSIVCTTELSKCIRIVIKLNWFYRATRKSGTMHSQCKEMIDFAESQLFDHFNGELLSFKGIDLRLR